MGLLNVVQGLVNKLLPVANVDNTLKTARLSPYGSLFAKPDMLARQVMCEDGAYFVATNPTPMTGIALTTSITTYAETAGAVGVMFLLTNIAPASNPKSIYMDYLKCRVTAAPTSATHWDYAVALDTNPARFTSGGSVITPVNPNGGVGAASSMAQLNFGALTTAVPLNRRLVGRGVLKTVIPVVFDSFTITFGEFAGQGGYIGTAGVGKYGDNTAPVIVAPGQNLAITMWGTSSAAAPSLEFEAGWIEK